ncbi:MAG: hypothetical protein Q4C49_10535 [Bacillota bacterium]|nr:hypothetical protein [Bacillota bacterium]
MLELEESIDVYYDMDIAQICQHFGKSRNTVDKAVAKLMKEFPDSGWKYKNPETKRVTIKAEGVEKLSTYFRKEKHEISAAESELRYENEKLKAIIEEKEKAQEKIEMLYQERLRLEIEKHQQTFLIEQKSKEEIIQQKDKQIEVLELETETLKGKNAELLEESEKRKALEKELEELKRKEEEYNSKSFFYRLTHKL